MESNTGIPSTSDQVGNLAPASKPRSFWARRWVLAILGWILLSLGFFLWLGTQTKFFGVERWLKPACAAQAEVLVVRIRAGPTPAGKMKENEARDDDYLGTHQVLLKSPLIIEKAVKDHQLHFLSSFAGCDPAKAINKSLSIRRNPPSSVVLEITYRGTNAEDCIAVLNGILQTYQGVVEEANSNVGRDSGGFDVRVIDGPRLKTR